MENEQEPKEKAISGKPKAGIGDYAHTIARAGLSTIPVVGGALKEFFNAIIVPPLQKHLYEWIESLWTELKRLEETVEDFKIENLSNNSVFATKFSYAVQIAMRNHRKEKLDALRNAVLNTVKSSASDTEDSMQHMFFNFVDTLTPWHLKILKCLNDPSDWIEKNKTKFPQGYMSSVAVLLELAFPELKRDFIDQVCEDLYDRGLMEMDKTGIHTLSTKRALLHSKTTTMGKNFLNFISHPLKE